MKYIPILSIAGSDSSGGAGIQADIKTISALGCYAATAITAITVQNTLGVYGVQAVSPDIVAGQIRAVMDDVEPLAVKIGMVNDAETIRVIAETLRKYDVRHIVIDPVMVSTSGSPLMSPQAKEVFMTALMPMATILTPNIPEAMALGFVDDGGRISNTAHCPVLMKGGHAEEKTDRLYDADGLLIRSYSAKSVDTRNTHGTGCSLSSAIASFLACGYVLEEAIGMAKEWISKAIASGAKVSIGHGHGPINHFHSPIPQRIIQECSSSSNELLGPKKVLGINRLQYITHTNGKNGYLDGARLALEGGCRWIQLRMKDASDEEVRAVASELISLCRFYGATLILDDRVYLAKELDVEGVHLGKMDMPIAEARAILGEGKIIGGTANTFEDIVSIAKSGADYVGCGPFRFTTTKEKLSPTLGLGGYREIISKMRMAGINIPIVAIGGITAADVRDIMSTGVDGIAVSGAILNARDPVAETREINRQLESHIE